MMNFNGAEVRKEFKEAFGKDISELSVPQVRWLTKVIKHCRGRCRNNAALNNYLNQNFTGHTFRDVQGKDDDFAHLEITQK